MLNSTLPPIQPGQMCVFELQTDALAGVAYWGDTLMAQLLSPDVYPQDNDMIVVAHRPNRRAALCYKVGLFAGIDKGILTLRYQGRRLLNPQADWQVAVNRVCGLYNVYTISRNWNREQEVSHE